MDGSIRERLLVAEVNLLNALSKDIQNVETFSVTWEKLTHDVQEAIHSKTLDDETIELAYATTFRIGIISEGFLDIFANDVKLWSEFHRNFGKLSLAEISTSNNIQNFQSSHSEIASPFPSLVASHYQGQQDSVLPPYIAPAYKWLLKNLHDPYPSSEVKQTISDCTGTSVRHVNAWFMNVRRRMGWTALSRKHFASNRADTVDAAYRALVTDDPKRPLESDINLDFMKMKVAAEQLYSEKFRKSVIATESDVILKDQTVRDSAAYELVKAQTNHVDQGDRELEDKTRAIGGAPLTVDDSVPVRPELSYPSPHHSPCTSPGRLSPVSLSELHRDSSPTRPVAGVKRRISLGSTKVDDVSHDHYDWPNKRLRVVSKEPTMTLPPSPKSPSVTTVEAFDSGREDGFYPADNLPQRSRKRRLSDANSPPPPPKRPRGLPIGPRLQTVSDPLPASCATQDISQFEEWFKENFVPPSPVTADNSDLLTPVDVDVFDGWALLGGASVGSINGEVADNVTVAGNQLATPSLCSGWSPPTSPFENDLSHLFNLDDLLSLPKWSLVSTSEHHSVQSQSPACPSFPVGDIEPVDTSWAQFTSALPFDHNPNLPNSSQAFFDDIISQSISDIDPSLFIPLTPLLAEPINNSCQQMAEKQAKLEKLQKHREEVRKLEAELLVAV